MCSVSEEAGRCQRRRRPGTPGPKRSRPSMELRKWYDHDPAKFAEFNGGCKSNIRAGARVWALENSREPAPSGRLALMTVCKAGDVSGVTVFVGLLHRRRPGEAHAGITFWKEANHDYEGKHT